MDIKKILDLDCVSNDENKTKFIRLLQKIKPVSSTMKKQNKTNVDIEVLEAVVQGFNTRYNYRIQDINSYYEKSENKRFCFYSVSVIDCDDKWLGTVYGKTLFELLGKVIIKMYSEMKYRKDK